jgi:hypothetical protein
MKDYFATGPNSAYGVHSGYLSNTDSTIGNSESDFNSDTPINQGGFQRLSEIDNGLSFPAKVNSSPFSNFPSYGSPAARKSSFLTLIEGSDPPAFEYRVPVYWVGRMKYEAAFHDSMRFQQTATSRLNLDTFEQEGVRVFSSPYYFFTEGRIEVSSYNDMPVNSSNHEYVVSSAQYDSMFVGWQAGTPPAVQYTHGAFASSGYCPTSHPMQSSVTWHTEKDKWSYPVGSGSEVELDVSITDRPTMPSSVTNLTGRQDWDGLHFVFTTNKHFPTTMTSESAPSNNNRFESVFNHLSRRLGHFVLLGPRNEFESEQLVDCYPNTYGCLGFRIKDKSQNVDVQDYIRPVDASGSIASGWVANYGEPNLLQEYYTKGGWAPPLVGTTPTEEWEIEGSLSSSGTSHDLDKCTYRSFYAQSGLQGFQDGETYVVYGDGIIEQANSLAFYQKLQFPYQESETEARSLWSSGPRDLPTQTQNHLPQGMHHTFIKVEDTAPTSSTTYNIDMWTPFKAGMDNLAKSWGGSENGAYYGQEMMEEVGAGFGELGSPNPVSLPVSVQSVPGIKDMVAWSGNTEGATPAFGYYDEERDGLGIELENITFIDLALAVEKIGMSTGGAGYTLNSFWLKFPVILGPNGSA